MRFGLLLTLLCAVAFAQNGRRILDVERFHTCALTDTGLRCWDQPDIARYVQKIFAERPDETDTDPSVPYGQVQVPALTGKIIDWDTSALQGCAILESKDRKRTIQCWPIRNSRNSIRLYQHMWSGQDGQTYQDIFYEPDPSQLTYAPIKVSKPQHIELDPIGGCVDDLDQGKVCWACPGGERAVLCPVRTRERLFEWPSFRVLKDDDRNVQMFIDELRRNGNSHETGVTANYHDGGIAQSRDNLVSKWAPAGSLTEQGEVYGCAITLGRLECRTVTKFDLSYNTRYYQPQWLVLQVPGDLSFFHVPEVSPLTGLSERLRTIAEGVYADRGRVLTALAQEIEATPAEGEEGQDVRLFAMNLTEVFLEQTPSPYIQEDVLPDFRRDLAHYNSLQHVTGLRDIKRGDAVEHCALIVLSHALIEMKPLVTAATQRQELEELIAALGQALAAKHDADAAQAVQKHGALLDALYAAPSTSALGLLAHTLRAYLAG